jgi:hypothetical protein
MDRVESGLWERIPLQMQILTSDDIESVKVSLVHFQPPNTCKCTIRQSFFREEKMQFITTTTTELKKEEYAEALVILSESRVINNYVEVKLKENIDVTTAQSGFKYNGVQKKTMKKTKSVRNLHACDLHRRKKQKCDLSCPNRVLEQLINVRSFTSKPTHTSCFPTPFSSKRELAKRESISDDSDFFCRPYLIVGAERI